MLEKLYTVEEAAAYLKLAPQVVYRKVREGLPHRRIVPGRTIRFTKGDLEKAVQRGKAK